MAIDLTLVGRSGRTVESSWTAADTMLYALAVGAGQRYAEELEYTTENSSVAQRVLPSFVCVAAAAPLPEEFAPDLTRLLHAEMGFESFAELPPGGTVRATSTISGVHDKGSGALVISDTDVIDASTGEPVARLRSGMFLRGEGGFGGDRGPSDGWSLPDRDPDAVVEYRTRPEQALLYRLTGDRNPLHSDPEFARRAGFDAPILHGMCTFGFAGRALLHAVAGSAPAAFGGMHARFSKTVGLGGGLTVQIWRTGEGALFRTMDDVGDVVLDRGRMTLR